MSPHVSMERRRELAATPVTLNGNPARIGGTRLDFPRVTDLTTGLSAEWSWETADFVVTRRNGEFRS